MKLPLRREVEDAFAAALEMSEADQEAFLARDYAQDPELRAEVSSMLREWQAAGSFLESQACGGLLPTGPGVARNHFPLPAVVGPFRIVGVLGEGGMGVVYEAEQEKPQRTVALKLIRPGLISPEMLRRFEQEFQALGRLQHPGIAQIHEAGTADSGSGPQPYFAMELIRGETLIAYAEARRLNTRQRLELMAKICDAVQHAHQRGIIHRDLKPGNIVVDESGQPKILDFGVARVTGAEAHTTRQTDMGRLVGTLAYMSPEQVLADAWEVDTRSDVYSLGVILFELLAGRLPCRISRQLHEAVRTIREEEPARLGELHRAYRGDIETIAAKALEKDTTRRYGSAAELASDIRRYLSDEPIIARHPTATYHLLKFGRRHKAMVAGAGAVFAVLIAGSVTTTWEARRARSAERAALSQRDRAQQAERTANSQTERAILAESQAVRERNRALTEKSRADTESATAKAINDFLENDLLTQASARAQARPDTRPDPNLKVRTVLDRAAAGIAGRFAGQPLVEASIRQTIGKTYKDLGLYTEAQRQIERTLELRRSALGADQRQTLETVNELAELEQAQGKLPQAESRYAQVLEARRRMLGAQHAETLTSLGNLARVFMDEGKYAEAEPLFREALEGEQRVLGEEHPDTLGLMNDLGQLYRNQGKYGQAESLYTHSLEIKRRVLGLEHPDTLIGMNNLAVLLQAEGKYPQAESLLVQALEVKRRVLGQEHPSTLISMNTLAFLYRVEGKYAQAEEMLRQVVDLRRRVLGAEHPNTLNSMNGLASVYLSEWKWQEAEPVFLEVLASRRRVLGREHPDTADTMYRLSMLYKAQGENAKAESLLGKALEVRRRVLGEENPTTLIAMNELGDLYRVEGRYEDAEPLYSKALEVRQRVLGEENPETADSIYGLARLRTSQGRLAEAEPFYTKALDLRRRVLGPGHPATINALISLAEMRLAQRRYGEAEGLLEEALAAQKRNSFDGWEHYAIQSMIGASLAGQSRFAQAEPLLVEGYEGLADRKATIPWESRSVLLQALDRIVALYENWGKPEKMAEWRSKASKARGNPP